MLGTLLRQPRGKTAGLQKCNGMNLRRRISKKILLLFAGDAALLFLSLWLTLSARSASFFAPALMADHAVSFGFLFLVWLLTFGASGLYDLRSLRNVKTSCYRILRVMAANTILAIVFFYLVPSSIEPRRNLFFIAAMAAGFTALWRITFAKIVIRASPSRVAFLGVSGDVHTLIAFLLDHPHFGYAPIVAVSHRSHSSHLLPVHPVRGQTLPVSAAPFTEPTSNGVHQPSASVITASDGRLNDLNRPRRVRVGDDLNRPRRVPSPVQTHALGAADLSTLMRAQKVDTIVIAPEMKARHEVVKALLTLIPHGITVTEFPAFHEMITGKVPLSLIEESWFLENLIGSRKRSYEFTKRLLDLSLILILGAPALLATPLLSLAIKLDSKGPVFFRQTRIGKHGKPFTLMKFRSMIENAQRLGGLKTNGAPTRGDPRHTRIGSFLRAAYLDEIPQIINILKGEMSFIGPRPERPEYVNNLKKKIPFYETRVLVPPGVTGWAQVNMEDDASVEDAPQKLQYDLYYIKNRSLILDLIIALRTVSTIIQRQGR